MRVKVSVLTKTRRSVFLPEGYPDSVRLSYWKFTKFNAVSQTAMSALGVLSTQQLLLGLGLNSLTASAALNWIMKDGLGQIGGIAFASLVGTKFDSNPRYYRWVSAVSLNLSCGLELLSPMAPNWFLPIAAVATTGKNVSCLAGSASRAAFHQHFALKNNLADVTVKTGNQNTCSSLIGMTIGTALAYNFQPFVFPMFIGLSAVHLAACYLSVKLVDFNTLNLTRARVLVEAYLESEVVLTPSQVSSREDFLSSGLHGGVIIGVPESLRDIPADKVDSPYHIVKEGGRTYLALNETCLDAEALTGLIEALISQYCPDASDLPAKLISRLPAAGWNLHLSHLDLNSSRFTVVLNYL